MNEIIDGEQFPDQPTHWGDRFGNFHELAPELTKTWLDALRAWWTREKNYR
jgi:hypothetical protein